MIIKEYSCSRFGGLKDTKIEFKDGINVILGPNEAGKSTIVNGIYSTLFKSSKLGRQKSDNKEFYKRFMPHPNGDCFDGSIKIEDNGESYKVYKEWGENKQAIMELSDGSIIKNDKDIEEKLKSLLIFGEGTYRNIVFARQRDIKNAIQRILQDTDTTQNISSILRRTVMELDGLSIEKLRDRIEDEIETLLKRWDYENSRPENNRDIHNPYKKGIGLILEAYYKKRTLEKNLEEAKQIEIDYEKVSKRIKALERDIKEKTEEIQRLSGLEDDVIKRAQITPQIGELNTRLDSFKELNRKWPVEETNLKNKKERLEEINKRAKELEEEYNIAKKAQQLKVFEDIINRVDKKKEELNTYLEQRKKLPNIKDGDVLELDKIKNTLERNKAAIEAGTLIAKLNNRKNKEIWITKGLEEREKINTSLEFKANGFLKLEIEKDIEIEIKSGEIDFDALSSQYNTLKTRLSNKLREMKVKDIEEAKIILRELKSIDKKIEIAEGQINNLLGQYDYEEIKKKVNQLKEMNNIRSLEEVEKERNKSNSEKIKLQSDIEHLEKQIREWEEKYQSHDNLMDNMIDIKTEIKLKEKELSSLQPLPSKFSDTDEFKIHLANLRKTLNSLNAQLSENKEEFYKLENRLPEISYEEIKEEYNYAQKEFEYLEKRATNLLKIKDKFNKNLKLMGKNSFKALEESFNKYLSKLTKGRYTIDRIDGEFDIKLKTVKGFEMPIYLLSMGTYDSISLALRFAILENIYGDNGLVILDDCLVDLDPERKEEAVKLIKEFAQNNQVIFTTCDPNTANLLGENIINL